MSCTALPSGLCLAAGLLLGCAAPPLPCASAGVCPTGQECLANRCVPYGGQPVPQDSQRLLLALEQLGVWAPNERRWQAPQPAVVLGGTGRAARALCLRFTAPPADVEIHSAFLLLQPVDDAPASGHTLEVLVHQLAGAWPDHGPPRWYAQILARGSTLAGAELPLRIDVTEWVRSLQRGTGVALGIALAASGESMSGASYHTGSAGAAPVIEVYTTAAGGA